MSTIRRPRGRFVASVAFCEFHDLVCSEVEDIDIEYLVDPGDIGDAIACWRPSRAIVVATTETDPSDVGTLGIHDVDLWGASPVRGKGYLPAGWRPGGSRVNGIIESQPPRVFSITIGHKDFGIALISLGAKSQFLSIG